MNQSLIQGILKNDHGSIARVMSLVENNEISGDILSKLHIHSKKSIRVGITGPPGAGKSTITNALIEICLANQKTVGVIAVDPTSPFTGGALLGDRVRMNKYSWDKKVFIRSLGNHGDLGGLSRKAHEIGDVLAASGKDIVIYEIGGTVGDIESLPFLEAIRQIRNDKKISSALIHMTYIPYLSFAGELKTKPTQHSVKELRSLGIQPDIIICRSQKNIPLDQRKKISLFCNVSIENVIETVDVRTIYEAPISFYNEKLDKRVLKYFKLKPRKKVNLSPWKKITKTVLNTNKKVNIAIIGKYVNLKDAYKSLDEALIHGGIKNNIKVNLVRIESDKLKSNQISKLLKGVSGILIPGGFGKRGTEGKISAINYARKNKIPFLGICFGMQMAVIEFARNALKITKAGSTELDKNCFPVIGLLNEWNKDGKIIKGTDSDLGGTMRLGLYEAKLRHNSLIEKIYKSKSIFERHRHRYEVNNNLKNKFENKGMFFSGMSPDGKLPEIIELKNHPWFVGVQYHPEFKSRPLSPHPLFSSFIKAAKYY